MRCMRVVGTVGLACLVLASAKAENTKPDLGITFDGGTVSSLRNLLTGEVIARNSSEGASIQRVGMPDLAAGGEYSHRFLEASGFHHYSGTWRDASGALTGATDLAVGVGDSSPDVEFSFMGMTTAKGLRGVSWVLGDVPDSVAVIVPGNSGQRFDASSPMGKRVFDYPMGWECQFVLLQAKLGGVLIYADDKGFRFKDLTVEHLKGRFRLTFTTHPDAPYEQRDKVEPLTWKLHAYKGSWQVGAAAYRQWANGRFPGFPPIAQPAWVKDIRVVVHVWNDPVILAKLAKVVDPKQTLLYAPGWRKNEYDRMYPDYEAAPEFPRFLAEAHRLGFRVMVHVNYFGCDPKHPLYAQFRDHQMRDPVSGDLLWWDWVMADPPIKFAYISPAYAPWRKLFVDRMVEVSKLYGVDALHLDQTLCIFNDKNGPIDGMTSMEGNLRLHQELRQALPEVALSGEGLDEITSRYEAFAQRHVWGLDHTNGTWTNELLAMAHPISSAILLPQTTMYGYLGMTNPHANPGTYCAWRRVYERFGVIPTFAWPDAAQLEGGDPTVAGLLAEMRTWTTAKPVPDFSTPWKADELFVYRTANGGRLSYVRDTGVALRLDDGQANSRLVTRRIEGVREATVPGSIPGWPIYDAQRILGLDPEASYAWSPAPRDLKAIHIESLPPDATVVRIGNHPDMVRFVFAPQSPEKRPDTIKLWRRSDGAQSGVVLQDGKTSTFPGVGFLDEASNANAQVQGEGLFIHPPWKGKGLPGSSYIEFHVQLPKAKRVRFLSGIHLNTGAEGKSDGAQFRVRVTDGRKSLMAERVYGKCAQTPLELDLTPLAGREVTVRLSVGPGPKGDPGFDWALFEKPIIYSEAPGGVLRVALAGLATADRIATGPTASVVASNGSSATCLVSGSGQIIVMRKPAAPVEAPADLLATPYAVHSAAQSTIEGGMPQYPTAIGGATVAGVNRRALHEHPPNEGRTFVDYWLRLPATPLKLVAAVGVRDSSKSTGVAFEIEVNGKSLFRHEALPDQPWKPVELDLEAYAGKDVLLTLVTDSMGPFNFDWAVWAGPRLVAR